MSTQTESAQTSTERLIRLAEVERITSLKRSLIYKLIAAGNFPKPCKLTPSGRRPGVSGWVESEIIAWVSRRMENRKAA